MTTMSGYCIRETCRRANGSPTMRGGSDNSSYYALPKRTSIARWVDQTPANFLFDVKLPRAFSSNPAEAARRGLLKRLLGVMEPLMEAQKLGAFLLTLPPSFGPGRHRLEELDRVADALCGHGLAVELRHRGWVDGEARARTLAYFRQHELAWVALDLPRLAAPAILPPMDEVTNPRFAYMRLHGRNPDYLEARNARQRHAYAYRRSDLEEIAARAKALSRSAKTVHVSVNNHAKDFAPRAALALRRLLGQRVRTAIPKWTER